MFPLKDENPTSRFTWMTWLVIAINAGVFAYEIWLRSAGGDAAFNAFVAAWSFNPATLAASPLSPVVWVTALTAMFLHAGWVHIGGNMLYLAIFGNNIEDRIGPWRFLAFYLSCGLAASVVQAVATGFPNSALLGASGAIAGTLGAYLLLFPRARIVTAVWIVVFAELTLIPAWLVIIVWFVLQLGSGLASIGPSAPADGVAYLAHVGGFLAGMLLIAPAWVVDRRKRFVAWR